MRGIGVILAVCWLCASASARADCTCISKDGQVKEGQTACISTAKGPSLARCSKVLNNTSWEVLDEPCPASNSSLLPAVGPTTGTQIGKG